MKFVVAPDSFKGSISAIEAASAMEEGIKRVFADSEVIKIPLADGGEGTVEALVTATGGKIIHVTVLDPLGREMESFFGILGNGKTAVIEMAAASGLPLLKPEERNPYITTTYGTGQLIKAALDYGCDEIVIGIGGSATNDGGAGMVQALGVSLLDNCGRELPFGGRALKDLHTINLANMDPRLNKTKITAACDVDNPLCGERGASAVYGPQKGASPEMVKELDAALANLADKVKEQMGVDVLHVPGAGAAGGLGAGILAFLKGNLKPGIKLVLDAVDFDEKVKDADLVLTGEGRIDEQTAYGKAPMGVAQVAQKYGVPVLAFGGILGDNYEKVYEKGIDFVSANVQSIISLDEAINSGYSLLVSNTERAMRAVKIGIQIGEIPR
ncbi:glycerate kinase [Desulfitibacter alkalitolerans]|uniref:glycerate kinase n=1 Tax=Desulfitibacter alkalitolerans TaxID=264641 RepID=UPI0004812D56|nr:glycerate kinase [Desulfitibacter alkalitolerans]